MWIITNIGFFSIVQKPGEHDLTVRARVRADLVALQSRMPELGPIMEHTGSDYPYRARVSHDVFARVMSDLVRQVGYSNFKDEISRVQGKARARIYAGVWSVLYDLERDSEEQ